MPSPNDVIISLRNVTVDYDKRPVLHDVSFDIRKGDFLAISGPNGGGKTTLLRVMLRLLKPTSGTVEYFHDGRRTSRLAISYLPQKSMIDTRFPITVEETVKSGLLQGFFSHRSPEKDRRFREVVDLMGIGEYLDRRIGNLSGGQLQRTLLGRALISNPDILVLDEPLSYVDKTFEKQIYSLMEHLAAEKTIVLVSHEMSIISGMATRHILVDHGIRECSAAHHFHINDCD